MVTKEAYLEALEVVEKFHKQMDIISKADSIKMKHIPIGIYNGAMIEFKKGTVNGGKHFTVGKLYVIFDCYWRTNYENNTIGYFSVKDDKGKKVSLSEENLKHKHNCQKLVFTLKRRDDIDLDVLDYCFDIVNKLAEKKAYRIIDLIKQQTR